MNIGIVGLGLIGGSLGLDLRSLGHRVFGVSLHQQTCQLAVERGAADKASISMDLLSVADVIFICTPIEAIAPAVKQLIPYLSPTAILTDVGSVKAPVVADIAPLWPNFIGGHPMAGKAEAGIEAAQLNLFAGKAYVLTPDATTPPLALETVAALAESLQARLYQCSPAEHDSAVAWISHLPVMVSAGLIAAAGSEANAEVLKLAQNLASSGFKDTSRVGGGNPELGVMMARYNRQALLRSLVQYRHYLDRTIEQIEREDWLALERQLIAAQQIRTEFLKNV